MNHVQKQKRIRELEKRLIELQSRMPAHSIPPSMMIELDELEEQLAELRARGDEEEQS